MYSKTDRVARDVLPNLQLADFQKLSTPELSWQTVWQSRWILSILGRTVSLPPPPVQSETAFWLYLLTSTGPLCSRVQLPPFPLLFTCWRALTFPIPVCEEIKFPHFPPNLVKIKWRPFFFMLEWRKETKNTSNLRKQLNAVAQGGNDKSEHSFREFCFICTLSNIIRLYTLIAFSVS